MPTQPKQIIAGLNLGSRKDFNLVQSCYLPTLKVKTLYKVASYDGSLDKPMQVGMHVSMHIWPEI